MASIRARLLFVLTLCLPGVFGAPSDIRVVSATPDNTVLIESTNKYCMILPRDPHTNVGDSEHPGGMQSYCSKSARTSDLQGLLPDNFWRNVELKTGKGPGGKDWIQLTGCIRPETVDHLNPKDAGGQYDSSGGDGGQGNPRGSVCAGFKHYVELMEPRGPRACIRCCNDFNDCPVNKDTAGCPAVIPGNYFNCD